MNASTTEPTGIDLHPARLTTEARARLEKRLRATFRNFDRDYVTDAARGDLDYGVWLASVDARLRYRIGFPRAVLADRDWRSDYDAGTCPVAAAEAALTAEFGHLKVPTRN
ncbi:hypothetical protein [Antribacter gilvus]|uniref:hypothetical protein n=1 Tax=Antribacter gilvus TaxID=2304675 RepID=UPI000F7AD6EF|nr:hypothetical protein [Antribacter gilvus]